MTPLVEELQQALGPAYRIERELGGGGMSRVCVAEEPALGRRVAVKLLPPDLSDGVTAERFRREIQLAARLQHPHIVPLLSAEGARGLAFYVMPYVAGETLRERLTREGALSPAAAIAIARDVAEALGYAHGQGVVHRDIKPENILLATGHALVLDFGVAKALSEAGAQESGTTAGVALGTPQYMSPEQAGGGADVDGRADLYALGVLLYEMLAGRPPFEGTSAHEVMGAHIADTPPRLRRRSRETSAALEAVVSRCLARRPADRYQTADELEADLERAGTAAGRPRGRAPVLLGRRFLEREDADGWHRPRILFRLGEIYEGRGEPARAAMYYSAFADLWRGADPVLQPRVADARRRLAALTAEPGRP